MDQLILALLFPAREDPRWVMIRNELPVLQRVVGGYIETVTLSGNQALIVNEEGAINGMPVNRHLRNYFGDALLVGVADDEFASLTRCPCCDQPVSRDRLLAAGVVLEVLYRD